jgi:hypothetical protein
MANAKETLEKIAKAIGIVTDNVAETVKETVEDVAENVGEAVDNTVSATLSVTIPIAFAIFSRVSLAFAIGFNFKGYTLFKNNILQCFKNQSFNQSELLTNSKALPIFISVIVLSDSFTRNTESLVNTNCWPVFWLV